MQSETASIPPGKASATRRGHSEGEAQAIVLARELQCGVLMDEKRGRQVARRHGIPVVGVLGVLLQAKREGHLGELKSLLLQLQNSDYPLSNELVEKVLELEGKIHKNKGSGDN